MHTALVILLAVVGLIVLLLILGLFMKKEYLIERNVTINKPVQEVFDYVKLLKNQENYNKWWMLDPSAKKEFIGTDGTVGFIAKWDSPNKNAGKGEQEIKSIRYAERVDTEIRFIRPFENTADVYMETKALQGDRTKLSWVFSGANKYPMNIMFTLLGLQNVLGKDMQAGLERLKNIVEK